MVAISLFAADSTTIKVTAIPVVTNSATTDELSGYIESIYVDFPAITSTATVSVVTSEGETIVSKSLTGTNTLRPRVTCNDVVGSATNVAEKFFIVREKLTARVALTTQLSTNNYSVTIKLQDK